MQQHTGQSWKKSVRVEAWTDVCLSAEQQSRSQSYSGACGSKHVPVFRWASQSSDLNPFENVWLDLKIDV